MYVVELALKFSPLPVSVERKELKNAEALYYQLKNCIEKVNPRIVELECEKMDNKKVAVLVEEILAVQIYEKTSSSGGSKKPGFSFE